MRKYRIRLLSISATACTLLFDLIEALLYSVICVFPPTGKDVWPFGTEQVKGLPPNDPIGHGSSKGRKIGLGVGIVLGLLAVGVVAFLARRWFIRRRERAGIERLGPEMKGTIWNPLSMGRNLMSRWRTS